MEGDRDDDTDDEYDMCKFTDDSSPIPHDTQVSYGHTDMQGSSLMEEIGNFFFDSDETSDERLKIDIETNSDKNLLEDFSVIDSDSDWSDLANAMQDFDILSSGWSDVESVVSSESVNDASSDENDSSSSQTEKEDDLNVNRKQLKKARWKLKKKQQKEQRRRDNQLEPPNILMSEKTVLKALSNIFQNDENIQLDNKFLEKEIYRTLPTLSQLCIKTLKQLRPAQIKRCGLNSDLPRMIKNMFLLSNIDYSSKKFSEKWLSSLLAVLEKISHVEKTVAELWESKDELGFCYTDILSSRKIWSMLPCHANKAYKYLYTYLKDRCHRKRYKRLRYHDRTFRYNFQSEEKVMEGYTQLSCFLPFTYWMEYLDILDKHRYNSFEQSYDMQYLKAVFTSYLDLVIPVLKLPMVKDQQEKRTSSRGQEMKKFMTIMKKRLALRYPIIVKNFFDEVLPYVHWTRGDLKNASDAFSQLIQSATSCLAKAKYYTELGRMYAQFGMTDLAKIHYMNSTEPLNSHLQGFDEVRSQMLMMIANLYDQGMMTPSKSQISKQAWSAVVSDHYCGKTEAAMCAAESMLCFHSLDFKDYSRDWSSEAIGHLLFLVKHDVKVAYHLSLLYALLGQKKCSDEFYGRFVNSCEDKSLVPGMDLVQLLTSRKTLFHGNEALELTTQNPFEPLLDVTTAKRVEPMEVMWRTQLHPFRVNTGRKSYTADVCSEDPCLRMTDDGLLTGNLQLMLPAIKSVLLDPYTGKLVLRSDAAAVSPWIVTEDFCWKKKQKFLCTPTPIEVYREPETGVKVHFIMPSFQYDKCRVNSYNCYNQKDKKDMCIPPNSEVHLFWTTSDGQRARLNLMQRIREFLYKNCKETFELNLKGSEELDIALSLLKKCYRTKSAISITGIQTAAKQIWNQKNSQKRNKPVSKQFKLNYAPGPFVVTLIWPPFRFGSCLHFIFFLEDRSSYISVFVNCSSRTAFMVPKLEISLNSVLLEVNVKNIVCDHIDGPRVSYIRNKDRVSVKNERGETVSEFQIRRASVISCIIAGDTLITLEKSGNIYCYSRSSYIHQTDDFLEVTSIDLIRRILIVKNEYGVKFSDTSILPLRPLSIEMTSKRMFGLVLSDNKEQINGKFSEHYKVFGSDKVSKSDDNFRRFALALDNYLVLLTSDKRYSEIKVPLIVTLPGYATDICFVHEQVGFLTTWTQHNSTNEFPYRECLFHYDYNGTLLEVLPFLGPGPRSFCPVYLENDASVQKKSPHHGKRGWYIFMQDGHDGILSAQLMTS